jgi:hypothetical protein
MQSFAMMDGLFLCYTSWTCKARTTTLHILFGGYRAIALLYLAERRETGRQQQQQLEKEHLHDHCIDTIDDNILLTDLIDSTAFLSLFFFSFRLIFTRLTLFIIHI